MKIIKSNIIYSIDKDRLKTIENGYIGFEEGVVAFTGSTVPGEYADVEIIDYSDKLLIPGFCDMHTHAPQFENRGIGMDKPLLEWLNEYTFPTESKYKDTEYAKKMYTDVVRRIIQAGTTRVCFFGTVHIDGCQSLVDIMQDAGLKGYVGKVNMDANCSDSLIEDSAKSIEDTKRFYKDNMDNDDVLPIVTPRFAISCTENTLKALGEIAQKYNAPIQSHINESKREIARVAELFPNYKSYADVYDRNNLMNDKTLMAHCVHMTDDDIELFKKRGVWAIHCPQSNSNLASGMMPLKRLMNAGIKCGIGTDVSGGNDTGMIKTMVAAMQVSRIRHSQNPGEDNLSVKEAFYLATRGGGGFFGQVGAFDDGYELDALVIDDKELSSKQNISLEQRLERFIFCGDDRNIVKRYIAGKEIGKKEEVIGNR